MGDALYLGQSGHEDLEVWLMEWNPDALRHIADGMPKIYDALDCGAGTVTFPNPLKTSVISPYALNLPEAQCNVLIEKIQNGVEGILEAGPSRELLGINPININIRKQSQDVGTKIVVANTSIRWEGMVSDGEEVSGPYLGHKEFHGWLDGKHPKWTWDID